MRTLLSPAQLLGFTALVLGIAAFLQKSDRRLKLLLVGESLAYVSHFVLLGAPSAASSAGVSGLRTLLSMRFRSSWLAAAAVAANVGLAAALGTHGTGWLPVVGSSLGTIAVFTLSGIPMRLVLLAATSCWLASNLLTGSMGGTLLEALVAVASLSTIVRLLRAQRADAAAGETGAA